MAAPHPLGEFPWPERTCRLPAWQLPSRAVARPRGKRGKGEEPAGAGDPIDEIDRYLDQRVDRDAGADEEAAAVIDAHDKDPAFRRMVRRLSESLGLGGE